MAEDLVNHQTLTETITLVNSSESLVAAVKRGDRHIQLRAHLNFTGVFSVRARLGVIPWAVQSIQVRRCLAALACHFSVIDAGLASAASCVGVWPAAPRGWHHTI